MIAPTHSTPLKEMAWTEEPRSVQKCMECIDIDKPRGEHFIDFSDFQHNHNSKIVKLPWINNRHNPSRVNKDLHPRSFRNNKDEPEPQNHSDLFNLIKNCGKQKDLDQALRIHTDVANRGLLQRDVRISNALISLYVKCCALPTARDLFEKLPVRNAVTWNALLAGYAQNGLGYEALRCFRRMQNEDISPTAVTFVCVLKACGITKALEMGEEVHAEVIKQGFLDTHQVLGTTMVDMYAKCGALARAQLVFNELPARDVVTWNALISAYTQYGKGDEALSCFKLMQDEGLHPSVVTFICVLKACGSIRAAEKGKDIHSEVSRQGLLEKDIVLGNALVDMYMKCGALAQAEEVFEELSKRDVTTWNSMITGYAQNGLANKALRCYKEMQEDGFAPDAVTFICILKACGSIKALEKGEEIHQDIDKQGFLEKDIKVGNALVDLYAKCGELGKARAVCTSLPARNVVTWTALIAGYAEHGHGNEALSCFAQMQHEGHSANSITFVCVLKACGSIGALKKGEEVHDEVRRRGLLEDEIMLGTALVDMYVKCGALTKAQEVFDMLPRQNIVTWNALIAGYAQHEYGDEALYWYERMVDEGLSPDSITFISMLKACGSLGAEKKGKEMHDNVDRQGLLGNDLNVGNALVDMYVKCGNFERAQKVFDELSARNVATWTSLVSGYAQVGNVKTAFDNFSKMVEVGIEPSEVTFVVLLTACSHEGLVEEGEFFFYTMSRHHNIIANLEHHTCMVDLFSRAGLFDRALSVIEKVPPQDSLLLWSAFMGACRGWANIDLGRWAFEHAVLIDQRFSAAYVCMSNTYVAAGLQDEDYETDS